MDRRLLLGTGAAAILAAGGFWLTQRPGTGPLPGATLGAAQAQTADQIDTSGIVEMVRGSPDAKVEVIEYASFTCPHCANFHANVLPQLMANYVDTGKVRFVYREVYFDRYGLWAAMVARCGGEARYFGIVDMIYKGQQEWIAGGQDPALIAENLRRIGRTAGISDAELDACLNDGDMAQAMVALYQKNSTEHGVTSTPSFVINGTTYTNMPYEDFARILDEALAAAG
ncbi:MAG: DsbA family protein [Rhodobacteraceae bacterium]|jgi:protein-disulfide isomerase|nr:DsbA family protein [Paracoccaceae bacterium]